MPETPSSVFIRQLTLAERLQATTAQDVGTGRDSSVQRVAWWRKTYFPRRAGAFRAWLAQVGASEARLIDLAERDDHLEPRPAPWMSLMSSALSGPLPGGADRDVGPMGLTAAFAPYLIWAVEQFGTALDQVVALPPDRRADVLASFRVLLASRLQPIALPTLGLAIHMERLSNRLVGDTSEDRLASFARRVAQGVGRAEILGRFPVCERLMAEVTHLTTLAALDMLRHLHDDRSTLIETFGIDFADLHKIDFGAGDSHKGGKTVCILSFGAKKVVYKPKDLSVDLAFHSLVDWLGRRIACVPGTLLVLARGDHGWTEFAEAKPCEDRAQVQRYYERLGALLALLRLCHAVDVHYENLICSAEVPYAIDLETLLHRLPAARRGTTFTAMDRAFIRNQTVLASGLLPEWIDGKGGVVDLTGAGSDTEQEVPFSVPRFENFDSDEPKIALGTGKLALANNFPVLDGKVQSITEFTDEFMTGFRNAYMAILEGSDALLVEGGPLTGFFNVQTRWVARPTVQYAQTLRDSLHPTNLRDALDREMSLAVLMDALPDLPHLGTLIASERQDLLSCDIPFFWSNASEHALRDSRGTVICADFFPQTVAQTLAASVRRLGPDDLRRQEALIRDSIRARSLWGGPRQPHQPMGAHVPGTNNDDLIAAAVQIGDGLLKAAHSSGGRLYWTGLVARGENNFATTVLNDGLYDGTSGIAVFLAELGRITDDQRYTQAAHRARSTLRGAHFGRGTSARIGAFDGSASALYAEIRISKCTGEFPKDRLLQLLDHIRRGARHDARNDVISGAAGAILACLGLTGSPVNDAAIRAAKACADRLATSAQISDGAASWKTGPQQAQLTGFAHGTSGIAYALRAVALATGGLSFDLLAEQALAFERRTFRHDDQVWQDLRDQGGHATAWCHGAGGIGLSRIALNRLCPDPDLQREIALARAALRAGGGDGSHCLCHGTFGNLDPFLFDDTDLDFARSVAAQALHEARTEGHWRCGIADFAETPGLMLGLSGIGYGLLRVALPDQVPSVLLLDT